MASIWTVKMAIVRSVVTVGSPATVRGFEIFIWWRANFQTSNLFDDHTQEIDFTT
jgi:hypothetical protein